MANVTDILDRTKALEKKYERFLVEDKPKKKAPAKGDAFQLDFDEIDQAATELAEDAAMVPQMRDRAKVALKNADIRKRKGVLNGSLKDIEPLCKKGKVSKEIIARRKQMIVELQEKVDAVPDGGVGGARRKPGAKPKRGVFGSSTASEEVRIELGDMNGGDGADFYASTDENRAFREEYEQRKGKQDEVLDEIEQGVGRLGDIATDMGQELTKQDQLIDEVEGQMDSATRAVQTNNQKLKGVLQRMRSSRNFCIDITLIIVILAVVGYISTLLT